MISCVASRSTRAIVKNSAVAKAVKRNAAPPKITCISMTMAKPM